MVRKNSIQFNFICNANQPTAFGMGGNKNTQRKPRKHRDNMQPTCPQGRCRNQTPNFGGAKQMC